MAADLNRAKLAVEGICEGTPDYPTKWAAMLTGYFDESGEADGGYFVIAGYLGTRRQWNHFAKEWVKGLDGRATFHAAKLRLGSNGDRHKALLERLGGTPTRCGLRPVYAAVRVSDYADLVRDDVTAIAMEGYCMALCILAEYIVETLPANERVELHFEQQTDYAAMREYILGFVSKHRRSQTDNGVSRISGWMSHPKNMLLEASDYLAYAVMQSLADPESAKSRLCAPILAGGKVAGLCPTRAEIRETWRQVHRSLQAEGSTRIDEETRKMLRRDVKDGLVEGLR